VTRSLRVAAAFVAMLAGAAAWRCAGREAGRGRDLLLVTLDTVRADRLGAYGYGLAQTPAFDKLAREGVRFDNAVAAAPLTLPSHATILTGRLPVRHGLRRNGAGRLPHSVETLATRVQAAGYRTGAFVGSFVLARRYGLDQGFAVYDDELPRDARAAGSVAERPGAQVVDHALAWLAEAQGRPSFAWVHLYDAHAPYEPPDPFRARHPDPYDGEIAGVDAQLARLVGAIEASGRAERSVVAVVADHGESLGDHGELTHGLLLYEPALRVPLVIRAPGLLAAGRSVREPLSLADLAPTLAGLLGLSFGEGSDGRDLSRPLTRGLEPPPAEVYAETEYPRSFGWAPQACLRRAGLKYVEGPRRELYDLAADPREASNRAAFDPRIVELERGLAELRRAAVSAAPVAEDAVARERLASLGYVGVEAGRSPHAGPDARALPDPKDRVHLFVRFERASAALHAGQLEAATAAFEALVAEDRDSPVFRGYLAESRRRRGEHALAAALYREAVAAAPDDPDVRYNLALTLHEAGHATEAVAELERVLRLDPMRPEAENALGIARLAGGDTAGALAAFDRAARLDPRDARVHNNRGNLLRRLGRAVDAERAYRQAAQLSPTYPDPLNGLGVLLVEQDRDREALPFFERALAADASFHEARLNRAIALDAIDDARAAEAYREFRAASLSDPAFAEQRRIAGELLARLEGSRARARATSP
jgi:arylsulfatase A-like enzyme/Flp pilus assembly protein TadD